MSLSGTMTYYASNQTSGTGGTAQTVSFRPSSCAVRAYLINNTILIYFEGDMIADAEI